MPLTATVTADGWTELTPEPGAQVTATLPPGARFPVRILLSETAPDAAKAAPADGDEAARLDPTTGHIGARLLPDPAERVFARCAIEGATQRVHVARIAWPVTQGLA